ncbi:hypothetical protein [Actinomadura macrotermitis]|uniref:Uncharacterized protein n=1 Tax=Actinomadura macrotermitis TaxID=2585200 RepID=A0A7K0BTH4_9ACTN|nr:hypothetical protein [Actinomadura macrotermitis]MQY04451.1 hypothetical protein [Actinomadura macrotermitis]
MTETSGGRPGPGQGPWPYDQGRYDQLIQWTGSVLLDVVAPGWRRIDLKILMTVAAADAALTVITEDGGGSAVPAPQGLLQGAAELRSMMYRPGEGTWFGMRYMMEPPGRYWVTFNPAFDPQWDLPRSAFAADLAAFPRDDEHVPRWLRERAGTAGAR